MTTLSELYKTDYRVRYINCLRQLWRYEKVWSCIGKPKENNILLYLDGCSAKYTFKDGGTLIVKSGGVIFCPRGSEYSVEFFDFSDNNSGTVGVNFDIDSDGNLPDCVEAFAFSSVSRYILRLELLCQSEVKIVMKYNILLLEALTVLGEHSGMSEENPALDLIKCGVDYLREHLAENFDVKLLADMCNMSEVYFRRLFKTCYHNSPAKYRLELRLARALDHLKYTDASVYEISEMLGFTDSSYFIKKFKEKYGKTPLEYRRDS